jgi:autotransporter-associated beta strand protein
MPRLLRWWLRRPNRTPYFRPGRARPPWRLEQLEDRLSPATFRWNVDASGIWNDPSNWALVSGSAGAGYPNAADDVAYLFNAITANRTITIPNGVTITVGSLNFNDNNNYTIASSGSGKLVFDSAGPASDLVVATTNGTGAHSITAAVQLNKDLNAIINTTGLLTLSGAIGESGGARDLTKGGGGTLRLTGAIDNTFTGDTTILVGTLELIKSPGAEAFSGNLVVGDGVGTAGTAVARHLQGGNILLARSVTVNADGLYDLSGENEDFGSLTVNGGSVAIGTGFMSLSQVLTMTGGNITAAGAGGMLLNGNVTIGASATGSTISGGFVRFTSTRLVAVFDGAAAVDLDISSEVRPSTGGGAGLTKGGDGTLRLSGANTYDGPTTLSGGTLLVGSNTALGTGALVIFGGTLRADGTARTLANPVTLGADFTVAGALPLTLTGNATLTGSRTLTVTNTGLTTFAGAIGQDAGGRGLTKAGAGTLRLSGGTANTYSGTTTVQDGTLELNKPPGTLAISGNLVVGDGAGAAGSAVARNLQGENISIVRAVTVNASGLYDLNDQSEDFAALTVNGGSVDVGTGLASLRGAQCLTMTGGSITAAGAGEVRLYGNVTVNASASGSAISGGFVGLVNSRTFTVEDGAAAVDLSIASVVRQVTTTPTGFIKAGDGTLRLSGANTYDGPTTLSGGTLLVNGQQAGSSVTVTGGTLGGTGTTGPLTASGGSVAPGNSPGIHTANGNVAINFASSFVVELNGLTSGTQYDQLKVNGTVNLGGATLSATLGSGFAPAVGTAFTLIDNDGTDAVTGMFSGLPQGATVTFGGLPFTVKYTGGSGNDVVLTVVDVPPPRVASVVVNGGAAQRSRVTEITVTFDTVVTFAGAPAAAFRLTRTGPGGPPADVVLAVDLSGSTATQTVARITFSGPVTNFGSLVDGRYTFTVLSTQVTVGGEALDGDGDGTPGGDNVSALHRLFGDVTGEGTVNGADFNPFRIAFGSGPGNPNYLAAFDFDGDGFVIGSDFNQFRTRFGLSI